MHIFEQNITIIVEPKADGWKLKQKKKKINARVCIVIDAVYFVLCSEMSGKRPHEVQYG